MPRTNSKSIRPERCPACGDTNLRRRVTTYPVHLTEPPSLAGKQIHVHRVSLYECQSCGHLVPTPAGTAKVERCVTRGIELFLGLLH